MEKMDETITAKEDETSRKYTEVGILSVVCGVLGFIFLLLMFVPGIMFLTFFVLALGILAIIFGTIAYWGMKRDSLGLTGFYLGTLLVIVWFLIYAYLTVVR